MMEIGVKRLYYEDFFYWTQRVGGFTAEVMGEILKTRADAMAISLVLNSFNTVYNDVFALSPLHSSPSSATCDTPSCPPSASSVPRAWSR